MTRAADLPDRSVVATADVAYIKYSDYALWPWRSTDPVERIVPDGYIDGLLANGARVLRVGTGED